MSVPQQMSLDGKGRNRNAAIRSEMLGTLRVVLLDPLIKVASDYAAEFVCFYCQIENLVHTQMCPASRDDGKETVQVPLVGHCARTQTTYVLCPLHATLTVRVPNPDGTVSKVLLGDPEYMWSEHRRMCGCEMAPPAATASFDAVLRTPDTALQPLNAAVLSDSDSD